VPGIAELKRGDEGLAGRNLLIAACYIIIGMAILAMCFDLIQEQLLGKIRLIGNKLGLRQDEPEIIMREVPIRTSIDEISQLSTIDSCKSSQLYDNTLIRRVSIICFIFLD
jgi:hypothetical protein